ncbi:MAG: TolC family protein [Rikenellaceae bacterium]
MNKIYKLLLLLLLPLSSVAQPQTLTQEQCREMAIENSFNLKTSQEKIAASEDMLMAYKTNNLPNFSLSGSYLYSTASFNEAITGGYLPTFSPDLTTGEMIPNVVGYGEDGSAIFSSYAYMPDMLFDFEVGSFYNVGLQATQPIYMGGKVSTAIKLAKVGVEAAQAEENRTRADVILAADEAFYTFLKVGELLNAANAYRIVVDECYRQVESLFKNGMCTKNDLMKVQVKLNEAELQQLKAKNGVILARMNLCYIIGLPISTLDLEVVDTFDMQQSIDTSLDVTSRPEFELLEKSIEVKELEAKLVQSDFKPSISAIASYNYANGLNLNGKALLGSSPSFTGGVMINIPIFHWGEGRRKLSAARREVAIAENTQADLVQKMTLELMQSINAYNEAQAKVALMECIVEQTEENLRQSAKQHAAGMETISDYLEAQALWQKATSDLVEAKAGQRLAYAQLCRTRGDVGELRVSRHNFD